MQSGAKNALGSAVFFAPAKRAAVTTEPLSFQDLILTLHRYWGDQGCAILQPYDIEVGAGTLRFRLSGTRPPRVRVADPDAGGRLTDVAVRADGDFAEAVLPALAVWQVVLVEG